MDFFEQQQQARRQTWLMLVMFLVAVLAVVAVLNLFGALLWMVADDTPLPENDGIFHGVPSGLYWYVTLASLLVIGLTSLHTLSKLSAGGAAVAEMVGARLVRRDSADIHERRLLNIVEEMALASGITVPPAYVMDSESGINAFAAGYSPNEAVIAVTCGALEALNRDELQGVIGHEFSHILNGDMRLNIRMMGVISGIVSIGALGRFLLSGDIDRRLIPVGLTLWLIGSVGVLAGRIIKATVSRQREFLADASSVQFTRNPEGIGAALIKLGQQGAVIRERHSEDLSHMFFGESMASFGGLLSTHPPLEERIERLMGPGGSLRLRDKIRNQSPLRNASEDDAESPIPEGFGAAMSGLHGGSVLSTSAWNAANAVGITPQTLVDSGGKPTPEHYEAAKSFLQQIPRVLLLAARSADGARTILFSMLLGAGEVRSTQLASIGRNYGEKIAGACESLDEPIRQLGPRARMPMMELLIPSLVPLDQAERDAVLSQVNELVRADHKITIGEFVLLTLCRRHLARTVRGAPPVKHGDLKVVVAEVGVIFSVLAQAGKGGMAAFNKGMEALGLQGGILRSPAELRMNDVEAALYELKLLAPLKKPALIKACLAVVMSDERLTVVEGELMRAVCAALDSPLPPLLDTIETAT